jgi:hypothetical protein
MWSESTTCLESFNAGFKILLFLVGSIALVLRNGLPELISGFLSLIRYGDD